jgi:hypothetical protein
MIDTTYFELNGKIEFTDSKQLIDFICVTGLEQFLFDLTIAGFFKDGEYFLIDHIKFDSVRSLLSGLCKLRIETNLSPEAVYNGLDEFISENNACIVFCDGNGQSLNIDSIQFIAERL